MSVKIITDSISDISPEVAKKYDIDVLPINVVLGDSLYKDDENFSQEKLISWISSNGEFPRFRGINPEDYKSVFEKYAKQNRDIVVITTDNNIISNYDCAIHASTAFDNIEIKVIDSKVNSSAMVLLTIKAAEMAQADRKVYEIADEVTRLLLRPQIHTIFDTIQHLSYTDYCPAIMKAGESLLNIKYHFHVNVGKKYGVEPLSSNAEKAIDRYCRSTFKNCGKLNKERIIVMYTLASDEYLKYLTDYIKELDYFEDVVLVPCRAYSTAIAGYASVGVAYIERI